jgi:23S rRNA (cytosine1962-C5)-methyltransferase
MNCRSPDYQLLDFGGGRKLERFGGIVLDRPCPAAENATQAAPPLWAKTDFRLTAERKTPQASAWLAKFGLVADNQCPQAELLLQLKLTPFGHVGCFPEQLAHWQWLFQRARHLDFASRGLNLFGYTGGSTLALSLGGVQVVHVDASAPAVAWARHNAALNGLAEKPVRWIVEDARKFAQRELRRGNHYDLIVLDPPSYGHGPTGLAWDIENDWQKLLTDCLSLLAQSQRPHFLWTSHSPSPTADEVVEKLKWFSDKQQLDWSIESGRNKLQDLQGRALDAGMYIRAGSERNN